MSERGSKIGFATLVGIVGLLGAVIGGFGATLTRGQAEGALAEKVEQHAKEIDQLRLQGRADDEFRRQVLAHMRENDLRWRYVETFLTKHNGYPFGSLEQKDAR